VPTPSGATRHKRHRCDHDGDGNHDEPPPVNDDGMPIAPFTWAERLKRAFLIEISVTGA
jgi:hypothetical protein